MKILFIGDPHIKQDNNEEVDILIHEIDRICSTEHFDSIIIGGDIMHYHERLFTQALNKSLEFIKKLGTIAFTYVMVGNHDYINNSQFLTDNHWMNALKYWENVKIVDQVIEEPFFIICPYVSPGRFIEALETRTKKWQDKKIIFAHQEFKGCKMGSIVSLEGDEWSDEYPHIISGHIHDNQRISNIYYPGTPLQHAFGDSDTRVLCSIECKDSLMECKDSLIIKDIPLNVPRKRIISSSIKDIKDIKNSKELNHNTKIKLDASQEEFKLFKDTIEYKELIEKGIKIQLQKKKEKIENVEADFSNFAQLLDTIVKNDEPLVKKLYDEIILNKIFIDIL